jgi:hypothetical protein
LQLLTSSSRWKVSASTILRPQPGCDDSNTLTFTNYNWIGWPFWEGFMPILENPRHEIFAQGLARGSSAAAAYVEAGYQNALKDVGLRMNGPDAQRRAAQ